MDPNGHELLELSRSNQLVATSTRQCWTWLSPFKARHRLDYMITRQTDADTGKVRVDNRMPVGFSGFRDHRLVVARECTRALWKQKQPGDDKKRWDRTLVEREYKILLNWENEAQKGQDAPNRKNQCFFDSGERSIELCTATPNSRSIVDFEQGKFGLLRNTGIATEATEVTCPNSLTKLQQRPFTTI